MNHPWHAVYLFPLALTLWLCWQDWRSMTARHRRELEEMRWRHFEDWMRFDRRVRNMLEASQE